MILQGVKLTIPPLEVGYASSPKKAQKGGGVCGVFPYILFSPAWLLSNNLCEVNFTCHKIAYPARKRLSPHWQGAIWGGGATEGTWSWDPGPRHGLGGPYTRKTFFRS